MAGIGSTPALVVGYAVGSAAAAAFEPALEIPKQGAWSKAPYKVLDPGTLARLYAQGGVDLDTAHRLARKSGHLPDNLDALAYLAQTVPAVGQALHLWRIGLLSDELFRHALVRAGLDQRYIEPIINLKTDEPLDLGAIATAVHRGIMQDAGLLVTPVPDGTGNIPRIPVSTLDTVAEFASQGIDRERARVLIADTGLPLSLGEMLQLYNRGIVTDTDVKVSIAESNVRNEYMDAALELHRLLLTPHEAAEAELRGVYTHGEAQAYAKQRGLNADDYATLFAILGRPLNIHQIATGEARGGTYGGDYTSVPEGPYRDAIRRSAIRPEYANLAYANRYTYPSLFQLTRLVTAGAIDADTAADWARKSGDAPEVVAALHKEWTTGAGTADRHVSSAQTSLVTATRKAYLDGEIDDATATAKLTAAGVPASAIPAVLAVWAENRDLVRKSLSPAKIVKAWKDQAVNAATTLPWTQADALAALQARGYSATEAQDLLNIA